MGVCIRIVQMRCHVIDSITTLIVAVCSVVRGWTMRDAIAALTAITIHTPIVRSDTGRHIIASLVCTRQHLGFEGLRAARLCVALGNWCSNTLYRFILAN